MKRKTGRFLVYFLGVFILVMIFGAIFRPSDMGFDGIARALVISFASAFSWNIGQYIVKGKMTKK